MNTMPKTSPVPLVKPSDVRLPETHISAPSAAPDIIKLSDTPASAVSPLASVSIAPADVVIPVTSVARSDEKSLDGSHTSLPEVSHGFDLEWSSYEHEYRIRGPYWFLYPLSAATVGIVFGITTHSYLFVSFVAVAFLMLTYYAKRPPRMLTYRIEKRGVWVEDKLIDYGKLKSFWIFTHALMAPELLLATENLINPLIHIRLEGVNPDDVRSVISQYLLEKEQKDLASHQIARIIGF